MKTYQRKILILVATATSIAIGFIFFVVVLISFGFLSGLLSDYNGGTSVGENTIVSVAVPVVGEKLEPVEGIDLISEKEATQESNVFIAEVTGYTTSVAEGTNCISAHGDYICGRSDVVACPTRYEFGTRFEIAGNVYVCLDRMGTKRFQEGDYFDIYFGDLEVALDWGRRRVEVREL